MKPLLDPADVLPMDPAELYAKLTSAAIGPNRTPTRAQWPSIGEAIIDFCRAIPDRNLASEYQRDLLTLHVEDLPRTR